MAFAEIELLPGPDVLRPTVSIIGGQKETVIVAVTDTDGRPKDLTAYSVVQYDNEPSEVDPSCRIRKAPFATGVLFTVRSHNGQRIAEVRKQVIVHGDPVHGLVEIPFEVCEYRDPGIFLGELTFFLDSEARLSYPFYVEVTPSLAWSARREMPLTIAEIRMWLRDNSPEDNFLLDEVEFKDSEIMAAIRRGVDLWNETPPMMQRYHYTAANFPYRSAWIDVTIGFLKSSAYHWFLRNHLQYNAGGVAIDDKNKWQAYRQDAMEAKDRYVNWMKDVKPQLNAGQAWGGVGYHPLP
jgi:hypothetical protein